MDSDFRRMADSLPSGDSAALPALTHASFVTGASQSVPSMTSGVPFPLPEGPASAPIVPQAPGLAGLPSPYTSMNPQTQQFLLQNAISQAQQSQRVAASTALPALGMFPPGSFGYQNPAALSQAQLQFHLQTQAALAQQSAQQQRAVQQPTSGPRVKVLLTTGGTSITSATGVWDYVGGETRLLGGLDTSRTSFAELAARVEAAANIKLGVDGFLKYELPGCPGTLVDVKCDEDVCNMWSELADFCNLSKQPTFKLHLYVERPAPQRHHSQGSQGSHQSGGAPSAHTSGSLMSAGPSAVPTRNSMERQRTDDGTMAALQIAEMEARRRGSTELPPSPDQAAAATAQMIKQITITAAKPAAPGTPPPAASQQQRLASSPTRTSVEVAQRASMDGNATPAERAKKAAAALNVPSAAPPAPVAAPRPPPMVSAFQPLAVHGGQQPRSVTQSLASFDRLLTRVKNTVEIIRPADLRIIRFIGSGGFADCYLARWLGVDVAVKCLRDLPGAHTSSRAAVKELLREASVLSGLRHPNVLCLYAVALPDKLSIEYGIGPAAAHAALTGSAPGNGGKNGDAAHFEHTQLAPVEEGGAGDEDDGSRSTSASELGNKRAQSDEKEPSGGRVSSPSGQTGTVRTGSDSSTGTPTNKDQGLAPTTPATGRQLPGIKTGAPGTPTRAADAALLAGASKPTSPFAGTVYESPFSMPPEPGTKEGDDAGGSVSIDRSQYAVQSSPAELEVKGAGDRQQPGGMDEPTDAGAAARLYPQLTAPSPVRNEPGTPDRTTIAELTDALPPSASVAKPLTMPSMGMSSAASPLSGVSVPTGVSVPGTSVVSYGLQGMLLGSDTGTGTSVTSVSSTRGTQPPLPDIEEGAEQDASNPMNSHDEDESMTKAVKAAEAAAAASADAESQTAVSEGLITRPALVAEFLSGCSVASSIDRKADFLSSDLVLAKVAMDAARGMEYCHGKRITHWNLKTGNLIVGFSSDKVPLCKVADIGLGRPRQLAELDDAGVARVLPWAAPELVRAPHTATDKVDVYSFGMVMWSLWARKRPFDKGDIARVFLRTMQGHDVRPPLPGTPEWDETYPGEPCPKEPAQGWSALLQRCWSTDPGARPPFSEISQAMTSIFNSAKAAKRAARVAAAKAQKETKA